MLRLPRTFGSRNDKPRINEIAIGLRNDDVGIMAFAMTVLFSSLRAKRSNPYTTNNKHKNRKEKRIHYF